MKSSNHNRREFLKLGAAGIGFASVAKFFGFSSTAYAQGAAAPKAGEPALVKESDSLAKSLGYFEDAKKVDVKKWPKRAGAEGAKQFCYNCQFYQAKGDAKTSKQAPCTIFAGKAVKAQGWCNSWVQNPTVKG